MEERSCDVATMFCPSPAGAARWSDPIPPRRSSSRHQQEGNCGRKLLLFHRRPTPLPPTRRSGLWLGHYPHPPHSSKPQPHLSPGDLGLTGAPSPSPPMRCDAISQWECPLNGSCFSLLPCQLLLRCDGTSMTFSPLGPWGPDLRSQTNVH